jgi:hypothetical protein
VYLVILKMSFINDQYLTRAECNAELTAFRNYISHQLFVGMLSTLLVGLVLACLINMNRIDTLERKIERNQIREEIYATTLAKEV